MGALVLPLSQVPLLATILEKWPEREEPRHAVRVFPVRIAERSHEPTLLEKGPDIEIGDDGRRRGGAVSRLDRVEGEPAST